MTVPATSSKDLGSLPMEELERELGSGAGGLSAAEAADRLSRYGPNEIVEKVRNPLLEFAGYFWAPIPWMIEVALVLSLLVRRWTDAVIIGLLLAMNGVVAFVEEHQAANAIAALTSRLATTARVLRDGRWASVATREVVPGDVLRVRLGDVMPADARLLSQGELRVDQSALTGESLPVGRGRGEVLYSGAVITRGEGDALVYATGANSFFGRTTALVQSAGTVSHFQRAVLRIAHYLIVIAAALVMLTTVVSLLRGNPVLQTLEFALVVTIASVPVALPAVLSVTMAVGARQLARQQAVVSHLPAVEELGGIDVLCSDKTGTLTQNRLAVEDPWMAPGVQAEELFSAAALASRAEDQDVIDQAVLASAADWGTETAGMQVEAFTAFDPETKRSEAEIRRADGSRFRVSKGAPQVIAELAAGDPAGEMAEAAVSEFAEHGYRSLAVAQTTADGSWHVLGVLPLADPPRDDSASTIAAARDLGLAVKMVTGDQVAIGTHIAQQIGLGEHILPASDLDASSAADADAGAERSGPAEDSRRRADLVEAADGFGQVLPEHKYRIVQLLQQRGHIVGMTGDGVNDAPALKQADAGIAVSGSTDAARAAADVVLLAPGLSVIVDAVRLAREIFARMNSYTIYRITETIRVLVLITLAIVVLNYHPVTAIMIVLLAVLNDGAILSIAYDHVTGSPRPVGWDMRTVLVLATSLGVLGVAETFLLLALADTTFDLNQDVVRTLIYLKLSVSGHLTIFVTRTRGPFWSRPTPAPLLLGAVLGTQVLATLIAGLGIFMTPLPWFWVGVVWAYSLAWFLVEDRLKLLVYRILAGRPESDLPDAGSRSGRVA